MTGRPRKSFDGGENVTFWLPKDIVNRLRKLPNRSEYVTEVLTAHMGDTLDKAITLSKVAVLDHEMAELEHRRQQLCLEKQKLTVLLIQSETKLELYGQVRLQYMADWAKQKPKGFWPNIAWLESRVDVLGACGFKDGVEAMAWFDKNRNGLVERI